MHRICLVNSPVQAARIFGPLTLFHTFTLFFAFTPLHFFFSHSHTSPLTLTPRPLLSLPSILPFALPLTIHPTHPLLRVSLSFGPLLLSQPTSHTLPLFPLASSTSTYSTLTGRPSFQTLYVLTKGFSGVSSSTPHPDSTHPNHCKQSTAPCLDRHLCTQPNSVCARVFVFCSAASIAEGQHSGRIHPFRTRCCITACLLLFTAMDCCPFALVPPALLFLFGWAYHDKQKADARFFCHEAHQSSNKANELGPWGLFNLLAISAFCLSDS